MPTLHLRTPSGLFYRLAAIVCVGLISVATLQAQTSSAVAISKEYDPRLTFAPLSLPNPVNAYRSSNGSPRSLGSGTPVPRADEGPTPRCVTPRSLSAADEPIQMGCAVRGPVDNGADAQAQSGHRASGGPVFCRPHRVVADGLGFSQLARASALPGKSQWQSRSKPGVGGPRRFDRPLGNRGLLFDR